MKLHEEKEKFLQIVKKYNLDDKQKAQDIANYLVSGKTISVDDFANKFSINETDSKLFLNFISKGIKYKEEHIDPNSKNQIDKN